jgi:hypothetical protein
MNSHQNGGYTMKYYRPLPNPAGYIIPHLRQEGFEPVGIAEIMQKRVAHKNGEYAGRGSIYWWDNIDSGDAFFLDANGKLIISYDDALFRMIKDDTDLSEGGMLVAPKKIQLMDGPTFSNSEVAKYATNKPLSKKAARDNPILRALAKDEHGKELLPEYLDKVFAMTKDYKPSTIHIEVPTHEKRPTGHLVKIYGSGAFNLISSITNVNLSHLSYFVGRKMPEPRMSDPQTQSLEHRVGDRRR